MTELAAAELEAPRELPVRLAVDGLALLLITEDGGSLRVELGPTDALRLAQALACAAVLDAAPPAGSA